MKYSRYFLFLLLMSFLFMKCMVSQAQTNYEDVVYLKNGSVIHGIIVEQIPNKSIKIQTRDQNLFVYSMEEIEKISKEPTKSQGGNTAGLVNSEGINKGTVLVGAASNIGLKVAIPSGGGNTITTFNGNVEIGYFFEKNFVLGANVGYSSIGSFNLTTLGAFMRYYIQGKVFAGAGYNNISSGGFSSSSIPLELGYAAFITKNIAIEPALGYSIITNGVGGVFGLNLGFALYLNRKSE